MKKKFIQFRQSRHFVIKKNQNYLRKILHPASDLYANVPKEVRNGMEITDDLFQLVVGGGNVKNLIDGLKQELIEIA